VADSAFGLLVDREACLSASDCATQTGRTRALAAAAQQGYGN